MEARRLILVAWLVGLSAAGASVAGPLLARPEPPPRPAVVAGPYAWPVFVSGDAPGIDRPTALPAEQAAELSPATRVVGITAGGRAYVLVAFAHRPEAHVVNDVLGGVPVSVTHCDVYSCTRVFTGPEPGEPLDVSVAGVYAGGMVIRSGGRLYRQDSGAAVEAAAPAFPYERQAAEETTWGEWRGRHPDTDVYVGDAPPSQPEPPQAAVPPPPDSGPPSGTAFDWAAIVYHAAAPALILLACLVVHLLLALSLRVPAAGRGPRTTRTAA